MMKIWSSAAVIVMASLLAGCDSEPSQSDIESAFKQEIDNANAQAKAALGNNFGEGMTTKLNSAKKISCEKSGNDGTYSCKVDADFTLPLVGQRKSVGEFKFIKADGGWKIVQ